MIKTKIIATLGPACEDEATLEKMIGAGMSVARFNMSHGTQVEHKRRLDVLRRVEGRMGAIVSTMMDLRGPDIRIGRVESGVVLQAGREFTLTEEEVVGNRERASVLVAGILRHISPGAKILADDGKISLFVKKGGGREIVCTVIEGGPLRSNKSLTIPSVDVPLPFLSEKDISDIAFGVENRMDYIAASFVKTAEDILQLQQNIVGARCGIIAKIEHPRAVQAIDDLIAVSDAVMVARGDLGMEVSLEEVPLIQKGIIEKCNRAGKPVITATQMLESMISNSLPTRAEASDVANAILDGTDAVMLSEETAAGKYPYESVLMMARIAGKTETRLSGRSFPKKKTVRAAVCHSTFEASVDLGASAIIAPTSTGNTARLMSQFRPSCPIIALTTREMAGKLALYWGVFPFVFDFKESTDEMVREAIESARHSGMIRQGDLVIITGGIPSGKGKPTNMMKVHRVGEELY